MAKVLYKLFLALMLALFIGFGIAVFYPAPKAPDYPLELQKETPAQITEESRKAENDFEVAQKKYMEDFAHYNRNVSGIVIGLAVLLLVISLTVLAGVDIIGDGILLSGIFTLVYGIIRGVMSNDSKFQFIVVTVGLIVAVALGYIKFILPEKRAKK